MIEDHFIELIDVTKIYSQEKSPVVALDHVHAKISKGEYLAVTGKSGCGKSTLINIIGGLDSPDQGRVMVNGEDISTMDDRRLTLYRRDRVGIIFQFLNLLPISTSKRISPSPTCCEKARILRQTKLKPSS